MDATYFLKERTQFIRYLYTEGKKPFEEIQRLIEASLPPYDNPPLDYDTEGPEPPFVEEWMNADTARDVLAMSCISLLSDSLKLYFNTLQRRVIGFEFQLQKGEGFVPAYKSALGQILDTDWTDCPADFEVIEQIVLARNRGQHSDNLYLMKATHDPKTLGKFPKPFFASEDECVTWAESGGNPDSFLAPSIVVNQATLYAAIEDVEKLADYIGSRMSKAWEWRDGQRA